MRTAIIDPYKNSRMWKEKVLKMPDSQVIALYYRFKSSGLIK